MAYDPDYHSRRVKEHAARFAAQKRDAETKRHNRKMEKLQEQQLKAIRTSSTPKQHRMPSQRSTGVGFWAKAKEIFEMALGAVVLMCVIYAAYSIYRWFQS